jgi:hypothetical protein
LVLGGGGEIGDRERERERVEDREIAKERMKDYAKTRERKEGKPSGLDLSSSMRILLRG